MAAFDPTPVGRHERVHSHETISARVSPRSRPCPRGLANGRALDATRGDGQESRSHSGALASVSGHQLRAALRTRSTGAPMPRSVESRFVPEPVERRGGNVPGGLILLRQLRRSSAPAEGLVVDHLRPFMAWPAARPYDRPVKARSFGVIVGLVTVACSRSAEKLEPSTAPSSSTAASAIPSTKALPPASPLPAAEVAAGPWHTCVRGRSGAVGCVGLNNFHQLGEGTNMPHYRLYASRLAVLRDARQVAVSYFWSCAILGDRSVACWGDLPHWDGSGEKSPPSPYPVVIPGLGKAVSIAIGRGGLCAIDPEWVGRCWDADSETRPSPGHPPAPSVVAKVPVGSRLIPTHPACVQAPDDAIRCFGSGSLEGGDSAAKVVSIAASQSQTCEVLRSGRVNCPRAPQGIPEDFVVPGLTSAQRVAVGTEHACALVRGGTVRCWGSGKKGQLGDRAGRSYSSYPVAVADLTDVVDITAGEEHTCVLRKDGSVWCWGDNSHGQLGVLEAGPCPTPVKMEWEED
jgi:hypothetical protein